MNDRACIYVVDNDQAVLQAIRWLIEPLGVEVRTFSGAAAFLHAYDPGDAAACLLLDVRMPEMSGLELQEALAARDISIPVIFLSGHADVPMAVRAMRNGAFDFVEKPFNRQTLVERINHAIAHDRRERARRSRRQAAQARFALLSGREREILERLVAGKPNKAIANELGISVRTVESHRAAVMEKMGVASLAELVRGASGLIAETTERHR